jgi:hypothetical protein
VIGSEVYFVHDFLGAGVCPIGGFGAACVMKAVTVFDGVVRLFEGFYV